MKRMERVCGPATLFTFLTRKKIKDKKRQPGKVKKRKPGKHDRMIDEHAERSDDSDDDAAARLRRSSSLAAGPAGSVRSHGLQLLGMMRKNISGRPSFTRHGAGP